MNKNLFDNVELESPSNTDTSVKDVIATDAPSITSPEWNDFVMSQFEESELLDGMPLAAGLRRVAELLCGRIISSGPTQVFPPQNETSHGRATVVWKVEFDNGMCFSDVADCWEGNTDDAFCAFAVATAATRAEARALRKALRIRAVAAEEITKKNTAATVRNSGKQNQVSEGEYDESSRMTDPQSNFISVKCKQLNINPNLLFKEVFNLSTGRKITKKAASDAIDKLNDFQRNSDEIPESIKGYVEDWRNV
jgi:hypothetical protein